MAGNTKAQETFVYFRFRFDAPISPAEQRLSLSFIIENESHAAAAQINGPHA
jgi:hypothetical protein